MVQAARKRTSNTNVQSRSKRSRDQEEEDDSQGATHTAQRRIEVTDEEREDTNEQDGEESSTQAISELETDITAFIRNTGKNDPWPAAFKKHVREREEELLEKLLTGNAEREQADACFQTAFVPFLAGCLARVGAKPLKPQQPFPLKDPSPNNQPLFTKSSTLIQESKNLLEEYSGLATLKVDTSSRHNLLSTLAKEEAAIGQAVKAGRRVAQAEIRALLGLTSIEAVESGEQGSKVLRAGAQGAQAKAEERAKESAEVVDDRKLERWSVVAAETAKAFGKMTKVAGVY